MRKESKEAHVGDFYWPGRNGIHHLLLQFSSQNSVLSICEGSWGRQSSCAQEEEELGFSGYPVNSAHQAGLPRTGDYWAPVTTMMSKQRDAPVAMSADLACSTSGYRWDGWGGTIHPVNARSPGMVGWDLLWIGWALPHVVWKGVLPWANWIMLQLSQSDCPSAAFFSQDKHTCPKASFPYNELTSLLCI